MYNYLNDDRMSQSLKLTCLNTTIFKHTVPVEEDLESNWHYS